MRGTIPTLAALVTATALTLAAPAFAAPLADSNGKAVQRTARAKSIKAAHKTRQAKSVKIGSNAQSCSDEYEYIYAGGQCAVTSGSPAAIVSPSPAVGTTAALVSVPAGATSQSCPGEYEYIYPGAQCAPASIPPAVILATPIAPAAPATDLTACAPEYDYLYGGRACDLHR